MPLVPWLTLAHPFLPISTRQRGFDGFVSPAPSLILGLRMDSFTCILSLTKLPSSTLVSCGVRFGYQCFIFIHREFSNIAYYIKIYIYIYTHAHAHTHTHIHRELLFSHHSSPQTALLLGEPVESPSVPRPAKPSSRGWEGGGQPHVSTTPEPRLFQRKVLCNWLFFIFPCASPAPESLHQSCHRQCWGKNKTKLHLKEKRKCLSWFCFGPV